MIGPERYHLFPHVERAVERVKNIAFAVGYLAFNHILHEGKSDYPKHPERQLRLPVGDLEDDGGFWDRFSLQADVDRQTLNDTRLLTPEEAEQMLHEAIEVNGTNS